MGKEVFASSHKDRLGKQTPAIANDDSSDNESDYKEQNSVTNANERSCGDAKRRRHHRSSQNFDSKVNKERSTKSSK